MDSSYPTLFQPQSCTDWLCECIIYKCMFVIVYKNQRTSIMLKYIKLFRCLCLGKKKLVTVFNPETTFKL